MNEKTVRRIMLLSTLALAGRAMTLAYIPQAGGAAVGSPPAAWLMPLIGDAIIGVSAWFVAYLIACRTGLWAWTTIVTWNVVAIWDAMSAFVIQQSNPWPEFFMLKLLGPSMFFVASAMHLVNIGLAAQPAVRRYFLKSAGVIGAIFICLFNTSPANAQQAYPGFSYESKFVELSDNSRVHYIEEGVGEPLILVHGAPTQAYLWRNIIPFLSDTHRVIALDLPNFGKSDKVGAISLPDYSDRFGQFIDQLRLADVALVVHDIGGPIALNWANANRDRVRGVSMLETFLGPLPSIDAAPAFFRSPLDLFDPEQAHQAAVVNNGFVEGLLLNPESGLIRTKLNDEEASIFREPFLTEQDRLPLGNLIGEIAVVDGTGHPVLDPDGPGGEEAQTHPNLQFFLEVNSFLNESDTPKHFVQTNPGGTFAIEQLDFVRNSFPDFQVDVLGEPPLRSGLHFIQEDLIQEYGAVLSNFADTLIVPEPTGMTAGWAYCFGIILLATRRRNTCSKIG